MKNPNKPEIISFNKELMNFNLNDLNLDELEQRLELALVPLGIVISPSCTGDCGCPSLQNGCTCNG